MAITTAPRSEETLLITGLDCHLVEITAFNLIDYFCFFLLLLHVLRQGGFSFTLKGAKGNHLLNEATGQAFYVSLETLAQ
jgi:hypothetical protein